MKSDEYLFKDFESSKGSEQENFPVGSFLLAPEHRPIVKAYYNFARFGDDIADSTILSARQKISFLNRLQRVLEGVEQVRDDEDPCNRAAILRPLLLQRKIKLNCASDLLVAFRQDADKLRYKDWSDLVRYCTYSANPVGRFLLSMHRESTKTYPYSDSLCTSLQVLNHLQDMGKDLAKMNRCYVPEDLMLEYGINIEDLSANHMSKGLKSVVNRLLDNVDELNKHARLLPDYIQNPRMRREARTVINLALRLTELLRKGDPLAERVSLSKIDFIKAFVKAMCGVS